MAKEQTDKSQYPNLTFAVVDVLKEDEANELGHFDFVLDSCLFHGFSDEHQQIYMHQLRRWLKPQGIYVQLVWSEKETMDRPCGPRKITKARIEELFSINNGWQIESINDEIIENIPEIMDGRSISYLSIIRRL
jgi:SAM-dependent methyltransferase